MSNFIRIINSLFQKLVKACISLAVLVVVMFGSFLVIKLVVHAYDIVQSIWPSIFLIF